jgi:hypothetical protein
MSMRTCTACGQRSSRNIIEWNMGGAPSHEYFACWRTKCCEEVANLKMLRGFEDIDRELKTALSMTEIARQRLGDKPHRIRSKPMPRSARPDWTECTVHVPRRNRGFYCRGVHAEGYHYVKTGEVWLCDQCYGHLWVCAKHKEMHMAEHAMRQLARQAKDNF